MAPTLIVLADDLPRFSCYGAASCELKSPRDGVCHPAWLSQSA